MNPPVFHTQTEALRFDTQPRYQLKRVAQNTHTHTLRLFTHDHPVTPRTWLDAYLGTQLWARGAISSDLLCSLRTF